MASGISKKDCLEFENIFGELDENKKTFALKLYSEMLFMNKTLAKLKKEVTKNGAVLETVNGNGFEVVIENPAQKSYNTMIRNYNATLKQLEELAPVKRRISKLSQMRNE